MSELGIVRLALPVPLFRHFDYLAPLPLPAIGARVVVPFGGQKTLVGLVVEHPQSSDLPREKLKPLLRVLDEQSILDSDLLALQRFAASYYHAPLGDVLHHALPTLLRQGEAAQFRPIQRWQLTPQGQSFDAATLKRAAKQQQALLELQQCGTTSANSTLLNALAEKGLVERVMLTPTVQPWRSDFTVQGAARLTTEQAIAVAALTSARDHFGVWLLEGITGSGKTEVYLQAMEPVLREGKQILVLVPEIGLTPQTLRRFEARFGLPILMLHSALNERERLDGWLHARNNQAAVVIGTRSALFTPLPNLGLIIIDEEHDSSFKQQEGFRYHARDLAIWRAQRRDVPILLGSATPALETLQHALSGKYHHLRLTQRPAGAALARHWILDLRGLPLQAGVAPQLEQLLQRELDAGNQVLLFLNRRGYAPSLLCHHCGWTAACPHCDAWLTLHQARRVLHCHHCDTQQRVPHQCPSCGKGELKPSGVGTEQLEEYLRQRFPNYPLVRIDRDTTSRKGELAQHLEGIRNHHYRILIGTQMLAKGHHFPDVTLVALLNVDGALFSSDFRASERFAQLYTQVAGRAGRAQKEGLVVVQSLHPEHALLHDLTQNGYDHFARTALKERQALQLPPFSFQALFRAEAKSREAVAAFLERLAQAAGSTPLPIEVIGPISNWMERKAGYFRMQLLLQSEQRAALQRILTWLMRESATWPERKGVRLSLDVDPMDLG